MNIFEGARRIAFAVFVLWSIGVVLFTLFDRPYVAVMYEVLHHGAPPALGTGCRSEDASEYVGARPTPSGKDVFVTLCFRASKFDDGRMLVPYKSEAATYWGLPAYSTEVSNYAKSVASEFAIPQSDDESLNTRYWEARWEQIKSGGQIFGGGLVVIWVITAGIGWIARGFMGIPAGQDRRPTTSNASAESAEG